MLVEPDGPAFQFYTSSTVSADDDDGGGAVDPVHYGYRGQLVVRDFDPAPSSKHDDNVSVTFYRLDDHDESLFDLPVTYHPDDCHRLYRPYRRLVVSELMQAYMSSSRSTDLAEYVQTLHGDAWRRDTVEPVYRPMTITQRMMSRRRRQQPATTPSADNVDADDRDDAAADLLLSCAAGEPRLRCVSDVEKFNRAHSSRQTWSPSAAATVLPPAAAGAALRNGPSTSTPHHHLTYYQQQQQPYSTGNRTPSPTFVKTIKTTNIYIHRQPQQQQQQQPSPISPVQRHSSYSPDVFASPVRPPLSTTTAQRQTSAPDGERATVDGGVLPPSTLASPTESQSGFPSIELLFPKEFQTVATRSSHPSSGGSVSSPIRRDVNDQQLEYDSGVETGKFRPSSSSPECVEECTPSAGTSFTQQQRHQQHQHQHQRTLMISDV